MTADADGKPNPTAPFMLDALLRAEFGMVSVFESLHDAFGLPTYRNEALEKLRAQRETRRQLLAALPQDQLRELYLKHVAKEQAEQEQAQVRKAAKRETKAAQREAARFYNQPAAMADLEYWAKAGYWTFDEAIALLLGREPTVLTPKAVQQELASAANVPLGKPEPPSPFITQYLRLCNLAKRAEQLQGNRLRPAEVVAWGSSSGEVRPPPELMRIMQVPPDAPAPTLAAQKVETTSTQGETGAADVQAGTPKRWTDEALAQLSAYRKTHGTAAAAKQFGITEGRVRQLLPNKPKGHSVFTHRPK